MKIVDLDKYKFDKKNQDLKEKMLERYGSIDAEWEAFLAANGEPEK